MFDIHTKSMSSDSSRALKATLPKIRVSLTDHNINTQWNLDNSKPNGPESFV